MRTSTGCTSGLACFFTKASKHFSLVKRPFLHHVGPTIYVQVPYQCKECLDAAGLLYPGTTRYNHTLLPLSTFTWRCVNAPWLQAAFRGCWHLAIFPCCLWLPFENLPSPPPSHDATSRSGPGSPQYRGYAHSHSPRSVGLLWTSDQPDAETFPRCLAKFGSESQKSLVYQSHKEFEISDNGYSYSDFPMVGDNIYRS